MTINNVRELRLAYTELGFCKQFGYDKGDLAKEIKRAIREYTSYSEDRRCIHDDGYGSCIMLIALPEDLTTREEADEYFRSWEYCTYRPSPYDCTGQLFTEWYKLCKRSGQWYAYHAVGRDI